MVFCCILNQEDYFANRSRFREGAAFFTLLGVVMEFLVWILYIAVFFFLARKGQGKDFILGGQIGFWVQSLAYVATYISAVALIGFGGLAYMYGLQMMSIALGNVLFGTLFVYFVLTWRTKQAQIRLEARTPAQLISFGHNAPFLRKLLAFIFALFLSVYAAAVIKGAAIMMQEVIPLNFTTLVWLLSLVIGLAVLWGGMKGVLLTEAMQGAVMFIGISCLAYKVLSLVGGPIEGINALAQLEPTPQANNGFTSFSTGQSGSFIWSLILVTSIAVWAQPQMIQRHFAIESKKECIKAAILASVVLLLIVGGMYFVASLSRLILPEIQNSDAVIPQLVNMLLPGIGKQVFTLAIISASISTSTALFHIASSSLTEDIFVSKTTKQTWLLAIVACILISGFTAQMEGKIISLIHTTSWSVIASTALVPYLSLVLFRQSNRQAATLSAVVGAMTSFCFYLFISPQTSIVDLAFISNTIKTLPPFLIGFLCSTSAYLFVIFLQKMRSNKLLQEAHTN